MLIIYLWIQYIVSQNVPPIWGGAKQYSVTVNFTNPSPVAYWKFKYYYDADLQA